MSANRCVQHGYDYSAICPVCGKWWREDATPHERQQLDLIAASLAGCPPPESSR